MKKIPLTITMRPEYKGKLAERAKEKGWSIGQYIEWLLDQGVTPKELSRERRLWLDAWVNSADGPGCIDNFGTLEEAKKNLCYFDGSVCKEEIVK